MDFKNPHHCTSSYRITYATFCDRLPVAAKPQKKTQNPPRAILGGFDPLPGPKIMHLPSSSSFNFPSTTAGRVIHSHWKFRALVFDIAPEAIFRDVDGGTCRCSALISYGELWAGDDHVTGRTVREAERPEGNRFVSAGTAAPERADFLLLTSFETEDYSSRRSYFHHEVNMKVTIPALNAAIINNSPRICEFIFYSK